MLKLTESIGRSAQGVDRRRSDRRPVGGRARATFSGGQDAPRVSGVVFRDSSIGGLGLVSGVPAEPGTRIDLYFEGSVLNDNLPGRSGTVVRCAPYVDPESGAASGWELGVVTTARHALAV